MHQEDTKATTLHKDFFFLCVCVCKLRCKPLGWVARLCPWKAARRRGGSTFSQGQQDSTVLQRLLWPPVGQRRSGTAVTATGNLSHVWAPLERHRGHGRVQLQPGAGDTLGFAFSLAGAELRHPSARCCGDPNPWRRDKSWRSPIPRQRILRAGRGGSGGAAMETRRASPAPRGSDAVLFPTLAAPDVAWPGPRRLSRWTVNAGEAAPLPAPSPAPVVKSVCNPPLRERRAGHGQRRGRPPLRLLQLPSFFLSIASPASPFSAPGLRGGLGSAGPPGPGAVAGHGRGGGRVCGSLLPTPPRRLPQGKTWIRVVTELGAPAAPASPLLWQGAALFLLPFIFFKFFFPLGHKEKYILKRWGRKS